MKDAQASNWVVEIADATSTGFVLKGSSKGYTSFRRAFDPNTQVFYSAHDRNGVREAGFATFDGYDLVDRHPTATLVSGAYKDKSPPKVTFVGEVTIACTFNAVAFNTLWKALDAIGGGDGGDIIIPPELIDGLVSALDGKADQVDLDAEIAARIAGDKNLQDQIDGLGTGGGGASSWDEITGKPSEYPPEAHTHPWDQVTGKPSEYPPEAHTQGWDTITDKPAEYPPESHTHEQSDVDGLEDRLEQIEDSITSGGGFVDAPDDGRLYGRQSEAWAEVVVPDAADPDWDDIQNKPIEFPPESHNHDGVYQPVGDYIGEAPDDGDEYARKTRAGSS